MAADTGTGTTIAFGTSSFSADLLSLQGQGISRSAIDSTHMGTTTARTSFPVDLVTRGTVKMEWAFDPDSQPPIGGAAETVTITFPIPSGKSTGATLVGSAFVTDWEWGAPLEDKMTASLTLNWAGDVTWTDSAI